MNRRARPRARWLVAGGLVCCLFLLSGCVYLRLLQLKRQLGNFDRFFTLQTDDGVRIACREPVLLAKDMRWIGFRPETTKRLGNAEQWHVRWVKEVPPQTIENSAFDIAVELLFADEKLTRIAIPERYFALVPKSFFLKLLKSLAGANIDQGKRSVEAEILPTQETQHVSPPNKATLGTLLGVPTEERSEGNYTILRYRFVPVSTEKHRAGFDMTLRFNTATGELLQWHARTPLGQVGFNFSPTNKK